MTNHIYIKKATASEGKSLADLRITSYLNSTNFFISNKHLLSTMSSWSSRDEEGTTLIAVNEANEVISSLRANLYNDFNLLSQQNEFFQGLRLPLSALPILHQSFACTMAAYARQNIMAQLRYRMMNIYGGIAGSISGVAGSTSTSYRTMKWLGYEFSIAPSGHPVIIPSDDTMIGILTKDRFHNAMKLLQERLRATDQII